MGDADIALAHLGPSTLLGRGLGAYIALMIAGARPDLVRGAVLDDGAGLAGGGENPGSVYIPPPMTTDGTTPDPWALTDLSRDLRPADYATAYVRLALQFSGLDTPVSVAARFRPPWVAAVAAEPGVRECSVTDGAGGLRRGLTRWSSSGCVGGAPAPSGRGGTRQGRGRGVRPPGRRGRKRPESHPLWLPLVLAPDPRVRTGRSDARTSTRSAGTGLGYGG